MTPKNPALLNVDDVPGAETPADRPRWRQRDFGLPRWVVPAAAWALALVVLAVVAQAFVAQGRVGEAGSTATVPLDTSKATSAAKLATGEGVNLLVSYSTTQAQVVRVTPVKVVEGKLSDFNLANPSEVAGMKVYYVTYTISYVNGSALPEFPTTRLRVTPTGPEVAPPNGMKNWNQSGCVAPVLQRGFHFGKGLTMTTCSISFLPSSVKPTVIDVVGRKGAITWPFEITQP